MKTIKIIIAIAALASFTSCGPNKEAEEKQKRKDDSLMEIQRNDAINNAEKLLNDTTAQVGDTVKNGKK